MNYIVFDTETTNGFDDPICYDVGWTVFNDSGAVLQTRSFVSCALVRSPDMCLDTCLPRERNP